MDDRVSSIKQGKLVCSTHNGLAMPAAHDLHGARKRLHAFERLLPLFGIAWRLILILAVTGSFSAAQPQPKPPEINFLGTYQDLRPAQSKLVDQWYAEYNKVSGDHLEPSDYNRLPISTRTTFEAVTHALLTTSLSDNSGESMGKALELVKAIETVSGKVPKVRGDLQFRIYVLLVPSAVETLEHSREFYRDRDNTVFHKGYPMNYRQDGGVPSIQISISKDGRHADIDVDYRSSRFPAALFNGHLSSANSDVRAWDNTQRHARRWIGLVDWWQNLFGLVSAQEKIPATRDGDIPSQPRKGTAKLDVAVNDFLSAWLIEQKPEIAAAYLSPRSFSCLEQYGAQAGTDINGGLAPYVAAKEMAATSALLGEVTRLQEGVSAYPIQGNSFRNVRLKNDSPFSLYRVTNHEVTKLECDAQTAYDTYDHFRSAGTLEKFGNSYTATFRLSTTNETGDGITLLWAKENKNWRIVAWEIEPEERTPDHLPDTRLSDPAASGGRIPPPAGFYDDPSLQHVVSAFFHAWLIEDDFSKAASYFSPNSFQCIDMYLEEGETPPSSAEEQASYIRNSLAAVGQEVGPIDRLEKVLESVTPEHDDLQPIPNSNKAAYTLVAVPAYLADAFGCTAHSKRYPYMDEGGSLPTYGQYYATLFDLRTPAEHAAAMTLLWEKKTESGRFSRMN